MVLFLFYMTSFSLFLLFVKWSIINHKSLPMEHGLLAKSPRIEVVDALRGFAVMAIILLHNIEHFNLYDFPAASSAFMQAMDKGVWDTLFFLFSGKAYAIFSLLFGFSFSSNMTTRQRRVKISACVSCGGFFSCSLSAVSTGRFSPATYWCFTP